MFEQLKLAKKVHYMVGDTEISYYKLFRNPQKTIRKLRNRRYFSSQGMPSASKAQQLQDALHEQVYETFKRRLASGDSITKIAKDLNITRQYFYKLKWQYEDKQQPTVKGD